MTQSDERIKCDICDGQGTIECSWCDGWGFIELQDGGEHDCYFCYGFGWMTCDECGGVGRIDDDRPTGGDEAGGWHKYPDEKPLDKYDRSGKTIQYDVAWRGADGKLHHGFAVWYEIRFNEWAWLFLSGHRSLSYDIEYWHELSPLPEEADDDAA